MCLSFRLNFYYSIDSWSSSLPPPLSNAHPFCSLFSPSSSKELLDENISKQHFLIIWLTFKTDQETSIMTTQLQKKIISFSFLTIVALVLLTNVFVTMWIITAVGFSMVKKDVTLSSANVINSHVVIIVNVINCIFKYFGFIWILLTISIMIR